MEFDSSAAKLVNLVVILAQLISSSVALPAQLVSNYIFPDILFACKSSITNNNTRDILANDNREGEDVTEDDNDRSGVNNCEDEDTELLIVLLTKPGDIAIPFCQNPNLFSAQLQLTLIIVGFDMKMKLRAESRKCSILPTDLIQKYQILLLLVRRDNQIWVLNLSILLSKKQKEFSDGLQWLSQDILG